MSSVLSLRSPTNPVLHRLRSSSTKQRRDLQSHRLSFPASAPKRSLRQSNTCKDLSTSLTWPVTFASFKCCWLGKTYLVILNIHPTRGYDRKLNDLSAIKSRFGVDDVIISRPGHTDWTMSVSNPNYPKPMYCGDAVLPLATIIHGHYKRILRSLVRTCTGAHLAYVLNGQLKVEMGNPSFSEMLPQGRYVLNTKVYERIQPPEGPPQSRLKLTVTNIDMENRHGIIFVDDLMGDLPVDLNQEDTQQQFKRLFPAVINTTFVQVVNPDQLKVLVWGHGIDASLANGAAACAAMVAAAFRGRVRRICTVEMPGGVRLRIEWIREDNRVYITGAAEGSFYASISF